MNADLEPLLRELVGAVLRVERRRQGRTLAQVAAKAGISMQHLSDVERGRKDPSSEMLAAITGALEVSVTKLLLRVADDALLAGSAPGRPMTLDLTSTSSRGVRRIPEGADAEVALTARPALTLLSAA
ncbi:helix-turn-helix domain-containing protein [Brachybacterium sp. FME24]|uniref:helix-turn-helix domain-containing protein n=1 Tax=Brachybacterium sp. FME24 TaxID=2742605 RepID=UPI00186934EB|nr:helix-turn-helix transcriptional regulator [Brachybacterium sp. FME24]